MRRKPWPDPKLICSLTVAEEWSKIFVIKKSPPEKKQRLKKLWKIWLKLFSKTIMPISIQNYSLHCLKYTTTMSIPIFTPKLSIWSTKNTKAITISSLPDCSRNPSSWTKLLSTHFSTNPIVNNWPKTRYILPVNLSMRFGSNWPPTVVKCRKKFPKETVFSWGDWWKCSPIKPGLPMPILRFAWPMVK